MGGQSPLISQDQHNLKRLLEGMTYAQTSALCVEALRQMRRTGLKESTVRWEVSTFQQNLYPLLKKRAGVGEPFPLAGLPTHLTFDFATKVLQFLMWLVRTGLVLPLGREMDGAFRDFLFLPDGLAFFDGGSHESVFLPDWIERIRQRTDGLTDDVLALLLDAQQCLDHLYIRPAIVVMGVAYEVAVERVIEQLIGLNKMQPTALEFAAARRISELRRLVDATLSGASPKEKDDLYAARRACDVADELRRRRNDASHTKPRYPVDENARGDAEELLLFAGRNLPALWSITKLV